MKEILEDNVILFFLVLSVWFLCIILFFKIRKWYNKTLKQKKKNSDK